MRELRSQARSPKEISRCLAVRPATVAALVRQIATEEARPVLEPGLAGCWVSPGWSTGLTVDGHTEWPDIADLPATDGGVATVLVARREPAHTVSVCGYLLDVYCLGVKNTLCPRTMSEADLGRFVKRYFAIFDSPALSAPLDLARHLVFGAVDYARELGFEPPRDFSRAATHLGAWTASSDIRFGKDGKPFYVSGPYDNPDKIMPTLAERVGPENYHFLVPIAV